MICGTCVLAQTELSFDLPISCSGKLKLRQMLPASARQGIRQNDKKWLHKVIVL